ncbi:MAG: hypothetical protein IPN83_07530 [Holophagales bacterium]|nr:hypothetical protein [Holophagales bacterium]
MSGPVQVTLTPKEWELVSALRNIPASPLKEKIDALLGDLVKFTADPKCFESQGDGVPCTNTNADCDSCRRVTDVIDVLRRRITAP